jgi:hypothetical protein
MSLPINRRSLSTCPKSAPNVPPNAACMMRFFNRPSRRMLPSSSSSSSSSSSPSPPSSLRLRAWPGALACKNSSWQYLACPSLHGNAPAHLNLLAILFPSLIIALFRSSIIFLMHRTKREISVRTQDIRVNQRFQKRRRRHSLSALTQKISRRIIDAVVGPPARHASQYNAPHATHE